MNVAELLTECGIVIANKDRWCQSSLAVNKNGRSIEPKSAAAIRWHACGIPYAVLKIKVDDYQNKKLDQAAEALAYLSKSAHRLFRKTESQVNDE